MTLIKILPKKRDGRRIKLSEDSAEDGDQANMDHLQNQTKKSAKGRKCKSFLEKPNLEEIETLTEQKGLDMETICKMDNVKDNFRLFLKKNNFITNTAKMKNTLKNFKVHCVHFLSASLAC